MPSIVPGIEIDQPFKPIGERDVYHTFRQHLFRTEAPPSPLSSLLSRWTVGRNPRPPVA